MNFEPAILEGQSKTGLLLTAPAERGMPYQIVWAYYQPDDFASGKKTDLEFIRGGVAVLKLPVRRVTDAGTNYGVCTNADAQFGTLAYKITPYTTKGNGSPHPMTMFVKAINSENYVFVTPFSVPVDCDEVRLTTDNPATPNYALLHCLSTPFPL